MLLNACGSRLAPQNLTTKCCMVQIKLAATREIKDSLMAGGGAVASKILEMNTQGGAKPPKILYCSRTHSQIQQVVQEMKKTKYKNTAYDSNAPE